MLNILCREESGTRARRERWPRLALCAVLLFCTVLALGVWIVNGDDLYDDETQYWDWSRRLDLGYYSKPPMIAYVIAAATAIGGDREFALRLTGLTFKLANIALLYLLTWRISGKERAAGLAALLFLAWNAMAKFAGLSASLTTNEVLLFFWLLSIFLFHHAIHGRPGIYPLCGIALGCANLSRFTALLLLLGFLLFTALKRREEFKRLLFYTVPLIGAGALAGVLFWNWQHDWVTWRHTAGLGLEKAVSTPAGWRTFSKYLIVQGLSANPVLYLYYIWLVWALFKRSKYNEDAALLLACALPLYLIYAAAAFTREVSGHWPQAAYPACIAGLAWLWSESKLSSPRFAPLWIAIAVAPFIVLYAAVTAPPINSGRELRALFNAHFPQGIPPNTFVFSDTRYLSARAAFYLPGQPHTHCMHLGSRKFSQYDLWEDWDAIKGQDAIFVTGSNGFSAREVIDLLTAKGSFTEGRYLGTRYCNCRFAEGPVPISLVLFKSFRGPPEIPPKGIY